MLIRRMTAAVPSLPLPPLQGYLFAGLMCFLAWLMSLAANLLVGPPLPALPFVMATVLSAGAGGMNPGLLATVAGVLFAFFGISQRIGEGAILAQRGVVTLLFYAVIGVMISALCDQLHRYRREALRQAR